MKLYKVAIVGGPDVDSRIELMHYLKKDFQLIAVGSKSSLRERFMAVGFPYYHYNLARRIDLVSDLFSLIQLFRIFRRERPDIVHTFDTKPSVFGRIAAKFAGVPVIVGTLPGLGSLYVSNDIRTRVVRAVYERLQSFACCLSDFTIFQNHEDVRQFVECGLIPAHKTIVIPGSGVRTEVFSRKVVPDASIQQLRSHLGISRDEVVVTMISRLIRSKGVLEFAEAAKIVKKKYSHVRFLLVGPEDKDSIDRLTAGEMEIVSKSITWLGERRDIPAILALTDIFVLPSFYREGVPRVLLEAASMGLPLIAARSPGCIEVVREGENGFLVHPRDPKALAEAIEKLVKDPSLRKSFGNVSRKLAVTYFDISVIAQKTIALYQKLLERK